MLFAGTYHSVLAGLVYRRNTTTNEHKLLLKFSVKNHIGCVNTVAACGKFIASAGSDERLFLYTHKEHFATISDLGSLAPASEVRVLRFPDPHFLVCGCEDGTVAVYKTRTWDCVSVLPVHEKAIIDMAFHPSGLVAVTIGADRMVALLDMQRGKLLTKAKVPKMVPHIVLFDADASHFAVFQPFEVHFYSTLEARRLCSATVEAQPPNEIHSAVFLSSSGALLIGCEDSTIRFITASAMKARFEAAAAGGGGSSDIALDFQCAKLEYLPENQPQQNASGGPARKVAAHRSRIRSMQMCSGLLFTSDTDGVVCVWEVAEKSQGEVTLKQLCGSRCGGRITTLLATPR